MDRDERRLDAAVSLGIITAEQAAAIRALTQDRPGASGASGATGAGAESPRAFNPATLAYVLGAITVLVAMGWFLTDRWQWLGAGGVLAAGTLYAALFLFVAHRLRREGFPQAAGFGTLLAVLMTPVAGSGLLELVGWFTEGSRSYCYGADYVFWTCRGEEFVLELATAAVALFALRRVRFSLLVAPLIAIGLRGIFLASDLAWHGLSNVTAGWIWMIGTSLLTAVAYATERLQDGDEDFALWVHFGAAISAFAAAVTLVAPYGNFRQILLPAAFVAFVFSLRMRRAAWLILGLLWFIWYLYWLAEDVFSNSPFFPIILAALGLGVIVATVWAQRNRTWLIARFGGSPADRRPIFPGGIPLMLLPAVVAVLNLPGAARLDRAMRAEQDAAANAYEAVSRRRERQEAARAGGTPDSGVGRQPRPTETTPRPRP
jgi:hypothetical protein